MNYSRLEILLAFGFSILYTLFVFNAGNANNFENEVSCLNKCGPKSPPTNKCELEPNPGMCLAYFERYFYNKTSHQCEKFVYGGCGGNQNNFFTLQDCRKECNVQPVIGDLPGDYPPPSPIGTQDVCTLKPEVGLCRASMPRFYFNIEKKACEPFIFGGCGGNGNNFLSEIDCNARCQRHIRDIVSLNDQQMTNLQMVKCSLPAVRGMCRARLLRFYYNTTTARCDKFFYGGCGGNENNFLTESECSNQCAAVQGNTNQKPDGKCTAPMETGPCFASIERYFFNTATKQCEIFIFGDCMGNENNYPTLEQCEMSCYTVQIPIKIEDTSSSVDVCSLPSEIGPCKALVSSFFFNSITKKCQEFFYGGCQGNENRFVDLAQCEKRCISGKREVGSQKHADCLLDKESGPCKAMLPRYFYNKSTQRCEEFSYGGCEGNANKFTTLNECNQKCSN